MAVIIQAGVDAQEYAPNARRVYYDETANKWWVIYVDAGDIYFENSTDGATWANQTAVNTDAGATCDRPTLCSDGTYLYVFWADDGSGDDGIHFRRITLSDSTLYPAADDGLVIDLGSFVSVHQISAICTATSGVVWVSIPEEGAGPWYSDDNGASWNAAADADINTSDMFTTLVELTGDKLMCIYDAGGATDNDIRYKIYDAGWGAEGTLVNDIWTDTSAPLAAYRGNAVHIGSDKVIWTTVEPVEDGVTTDLVVYLYDAGWSEKTEVKANDYTSWAIPAYDETNNKLYVYYDKYDAINANEPAYQTSIDEGANWSGETVIEEQWGTTIGSSINANSAEKLGVTFLTLGSLYFEEIANLVAGPDVNGVAFASIAKIDGIAAASIAKIDGVTF